MVELAVSGGGETGWLGGLTWDELGDFTRKNESTEAAKTGNKCQAVRPSFACLHWLVDRLEFDILNDECR